MKNFRHLLIFALTFSAFLLSAQTKDRFSYGFALTPKTSFVHFSDREVASSNNRLGYNGQLVVHYQINDRFAFLTGIEHSMDHFERFDYSITFGSDFDPVTGFDITNSWVVNDIELYYLGVPIEVRYYLKRSGTSWYTKIGFEYLLKIADRQRSVIFESGVNEIAFMGDIVDTPRDFATKFHLGFGLERSLSTSTFLFIEPELAYSATVVNEGITVFSNTTNPYRLLDIGLRTGIRF